MNKKPKLCDVIALDCEMVYVGPPGKRRRILAKISLVNSDLQVLLDEYVAPTEEVTDYVTRISGITKEHLSGENVRSFAEVMNDVRSKLDHKVIIGHDLKNDFEVMDYDHPLDLICDTSRYTGIRDENYMNRTPGLKLLVKNHLGHEIQSGEHDSLEDAQAVMKLYLKFRETWEEDIRNYRAKARNEIEGTQYTFENLKTLHPEHIFSEDLNYVVREKSEIIQWAEEWIKYRSFDATLFKRRKLKNLNIKSAFNLLTNDQLKSWIQILAGKQRKRSKAKKLKPIKNTNEIGSNSNICYTSEFLENLPADHKFHKNISKAFGNDTLKIKAWTEKWIKIRKDRQDYRKFKPSLENTTGQSVYLSFCKALNKLSNDQLHQYLLQLNQKHSPDPVYSIDNLKNLPSDHEFTDDIEKPFFNKTGRSKYPSYQKWTAEWIKMRSDKEDYECTKKELENMEIKKAFNSLSNEQLEIWSQHLWYTPEGTKQVFMCNSC